MKKYIIKLSLFAIGFFLILVTISCDSTSNNDIEEQAGEEDSITWTVDMVDLTVTDDGTRKNGVMSELESVDFTAATFISDYCFDYVLLNAKGPNGEKINKYFDYASFLTGKNYDECFYDTVEAKEEKENILEDMKQVYCDLKNGTYAYYGYDSDYEYLPFLTGLFGKYYGYEINTLVDFAIFMLYQDVMEEYYNSVSAINNVNDLYVKLYYADIIDSYFYASGYHCLICKMDGDSIKYTDEFSEEEKNAALSLYGIIEKVVDNYQYDDANGYTLYEFFTKLADLFDNGNFSDPGDVLLYFFNVGSISASELEPYFVDGFSIIAETLEITEGQMVTEFEDAVKEMFYSHLDEVIENKKVEKEEVHDGAILTTYGYHFYVNQVCSLENIVSEDEFLKVPNRVDFAMYYDYYYYSSSDDYINPIELFKTYLSATIEKDNTKIDEAINALYDYVKYLDLDCLKDVTLANVKTDFIDKYLTTYTNYNYLVSELKEGETVDLESITFGAMAQSAYYFYKPIYEYYTGDYYYMYTILIEMIEEFKELDLKTHEEQINTMMTTYLEAYQEKIGDIMDHRVDLETGLLEKIDKELYDELKLYFETLPEENAEEESN